MGPDNATALSIRRWLLLSGWLEICVGLGHNVLGSLIIVRPTLVAALLVGPATAGSPVLAQELPAADPAAGELLMTALERYWARMEQVDDFLVVQETSGFETAGATL